MSKEIANMSTALSHQRCRSSSRATAMSASVTRMLLWSIVASILLSLVLFGWLFSWESADASTDVGMKSNHQQEPIINGVERLWVDVTRWWKGKPLEPTASTIKKVVDSYKSGKWSPQGLPTTDASGRWWQLLTRPKYTSGVMFAMPYHWVQVGKGVWDGCWVDDRNKKAPAMNAPVKAGSTDWCARFK